MKYLLLLFVCVFVSVTAGALDGKMFCTKARNLYDQWYGILPSRQPFVQSCHAVVRSEPFGANVIFMNPSVKDGKVNVACKLTVCLPDGKPMLSRDLKTQTFECPNPESVFLFSDTVMMNFKQTDIPGEYVFIAEIKDLNSGKTVTAQTKVLLEEKPSGKPDKEPLNALCDYYQNQNPQNILPAFGEFLKMIPDLKAQEKANFNPFSMLALFCYALQANPQLQGDFAKMVDSLKDPESRYYGVIIMHELGEEPFSMLSKESQAKWNPDLVAPFKVEKANAPWQLDILWSEFLVTGKKAPLVKIVDAVQYMNGNLSKEEYKKLKNPTEKDKASFWRYLTGLSALWSLGGNAQQHPLVADYLEFMVTQEEIKDAFTDIAIAKKLEASGNTSVSVSIPE